jgi:sugar lactone lactonase YvrE
VFTYAHVNSPRGLAFDSSDNLYVADFNDVKVVKVAPNGTVTDFDTNLFGTPQPVRLGSDGRLYIGSPQAEEVDVCDLSGTCYTGAYSNLVPTDMVFDSAGNAYFSENGNNDIVEVNAAGKASTFATGLNKPIGLAIDSQNNLYEVDQGSFTVNKFAPNGTKSTFATLDSSVVSVPARATTDSSDNVYISAFTKSGGGIIYKYTPTGAQSTFATLSEPISFMTFGPTPPPAHLLNISTRMEVLSGNNVLIAGFIITGPAGSSKKVMIRGLGPSLSNQGVSNPLADPYLDLHKSDGTEVTNDNWQDASNSSDIPAGFQPSDPHESVIVTTIPIGSNGVSANTAILRGANGETGIGLVEVYDLDTTTGQLANISTRGFVDTSDNVLIGGFITGPNTSRNPNIVVRAIGPSLTDSNGQPLAGSLQDPTLVLNNANGTAIATNDNWKIDDSTGQSQEALIRATQLQPSNDAESALLRSLPPGAYTAIVRGKNGTTGIGLVEVYNLQ